MHNLRTIFILHFRTIQRPHSNGHLEQRLSYRHKWTNTHTRVENKFTTFYTQSAHADCFAEKSLIGRLHREWAALWSNYKTCEKLSLKLQNFNTVYLLLNYECSLFPYLAWWLRSLLSRYLCWMLILINDWESQQLVLSKIRLHSLLFFAILECQSTCLRALSARILRNRVNCYILREKKQEITKIKQKITTFCYVLILSFLSISRLFTSWI